MANKIIKTIGDIINVKNIRNLLTIVLLAVLVFVMFGPINPAEYKMLKIDTTKQYVAGSQLPYEISYCRYVGDTVRTDVFRTLIDVEKKQQPITLSIDNNTSQPKCVDNLQRTATIPLDTPTGCYNLKIVGLYSVFPLRQPIPREAISDKFCVTKPTVREQINTLEQQLQNLKLQLEQQGAESGDVSVTPSNAEEGSAPIVVAPRNNTPVATVPQQTPTPATRPPATVTAPPEPTIVTQLVDGTIDLTKDTLTNIRNILPF